ncbi:hypothetical protein BH10PSE1_BH10PSE1_21070 [soil metagenome]
MIRAVVPLPGLLIALFVAAPAMAQTRQTEASVTVERSVGVSEVSRMIFNATATTEQGVSAPPPEQTALSTAGGSAASAPAVIRITGDPGRAYRVNLPQSIADPLTNATITSLTVWSENSGDITTSLTARMDEEGRDTLRVTGFLSSVAFTDVNAAVPIVVNYE